MRALLFSSTGGGLGIAQHLQQEGHSVKVCINNADLHNVEEQFGTGEQPDVVVFDSNSYVVPAEWVRVRGIRVLGPTKWSNLIDDNIEYNKQLLEAIGLKAAPALTGADMEAVVCAWFNGNNFISKFLVFNYDKMMSGDVGTTVSSSGYIAYFNECKLVNQVLEPIEKFLRKANHRGCFSIDIQVDTTGKIYGKSVSANSNLPYTNALYENTRKSKGDLVLSMFDPTSAPVKALDPYVCGVMLSVYPYPYTKPNEPLEVFGLNSSNQKHMWQMDVSKVKDKFVCGALSGNAGYVTARGQSVQEVQRRVYRTIANLKVEGLQFRDDIGKHITDKIYKLRNLNLL
jgi:phosphoribosylamine-glycine ligase